MLEGLVEIVIFFESVLCGTNYVRALRRGLLVLHFAIEAVLDGKQTRNYENASGNIEDLLTAMSNKCAATTRSLFYKYSTSAAELRNKLCEFTCSLSYQP